MTRSNRLTEALKAIDEANAEDPHRESDGSRDWPKELLYSRRMSDRLARYAPDASDELRIAAHAQHIRRWTIPRTDFPMTRAGYIKWRTTLGAFHADETAKLMEVAGYAPESIATARALLQKQNLKSDSNVQILEDVICLVFLEHYLDDFARKHDEEKIVSIIRKTWRKMSDRGHEEAGTVPLSPNIKSLVEKALAAT